MKEIITNGFYGTLIVARFLENLNNLVKLRAQMD